MNGTASPWTRLVVRGVRCFDREWEAILTVEGGRRITAARTQQSFSPSTDHTTLLLMLCNRVAVAASAPHPHHELLQPAELSALLSEPVVSSRSSLYKLMTTLACTYTVSIQRGTIHGLGHNPWFHITFPFSRALFNSRFFMFRAFYELIRFKKFVSQITHTVQLIIFYLYLILQVCV